MISQVEVHVVRDGNFYFHSRYENGRASIMAQRVTAERAREIVEASKEAESFSTRGLVSFEPGDGWFSALARWAKFETGL